MDRFKVISKNKINTLPKTAGVYCFIEKTAENGSPLIYIGKAINIQSRVKNHFQQPSYKDDFYINKIHKIGYLETNSEIEALILEANLIKKNQPRFNVIWRDDKNYFYVAITENKDNIPYIFITHQPSSHSVIPLKKGIQILDPRIRGDDKRSVNIRFIGPFVDGTALKKTLRFLRKAFPYYTIKKHSKNKCTYCHLDLCPGPNPNLIEYKKNIKKLILILEGKRNAVLNSLKKEMKHLSIKKDFEKAGKTRDTIYVLQRVMSHKEIISQELTRELFSWSSSKTVLVESAKILQKLARTNQLVSKIEAYDVSNIQGKHATGSMVVFINNTPEKRQYKKFKIHIKNKPNDIAMLKETIERRLLHKEWKYPEIMLIDGGIAQLNIAISVKNQNVNTKHIKVISIAKKNKELYIENKKQPILLKSLPQEIFNLILQLDDEAHRFAIAYHKKLRKKQLLH